MADEDPEDGRLGEALLDPPVAAATDLAVVEVRLGRVDRDHDHVADATDGVARAEELLEVDVTHVPRIVVPGDDDALALDPVEIGLGLPVLLLEAEGRQVAGADDDVRLEIVDLGDGALEQVWKEVRAAAVEVRDLRDRERSVTAHRAEV